MASRNFDTGQYVQPRTVSGVKDKFAPVDRVVVSNGDYLEAGFQREIHKLGWSGVLPSVSNVFRGRSMDMQVGLTELGSDAFVQQ